jgi:hypothetical protein
MSLFRQKEVLRPVVCFAAANLVARGDKAKSEFRWWNAGCWLRSTITVFTVIVVLKFGLNIIIFLLFFSA